MIDGYMNIKEMLDRWGISIRRIQTLSSDGCNDGASKLGREWFILVYTEKPADNSVTMGKS